MITHPEARYRVSQQVYDLACMRADMEYRPLWEWDGFNLLESFNIIGDFLLPSPDEAVGRVLFDMDEAVAIQQLFDAPLDEKAAEAAWPEREVYLRSDEFQNVINLAERCLDMMLRADHGLPGFIPAGEVYVPPATAPSAKPTGDESQL